MSEKVKLFIDYSLKSLMENLDNYAKTSEQNILYTESLLGEHFRGMYAFFCKYFFKFTKNTYTVILTRRCTSLGVWNINLISEILRDIIKQNFEIVETDGDGLISIKNKKTNQVNILISDKYLESNPHLNSEFQFVIVDDICIHGRHLAEIENCIKKIYPNAVTKKVSYLLSEDSVYEKPDEFWIAATGNHWVNLSNSIVDVINYFNVPYVSYLPTLMKFKVSYNDFDELYQKLKKDNNIVDYTNERQSKLGRHSLLLTEKNINLLEKERYKCCRIYYNEHTNNLSLIPYVFYEKLTKEASDNLFKYYLKANKANSIKEIISNYDISQKHRILSCVASFSYGIYLWQTYNIGNNWLCDYYRNLQLSFGKTILEIILNPENYTSIQFNEFEVKQTGNVSEQLSDYEIPMKDILIKQWLKNEVNACYKQSKVPKMDLNDFIKDKDLNYLEFVALLRLCDSGAACIYIESDKNGNYSGDMVDVGELGVNLVNDKPLTDYDDDQIIQSLKGASIYYKSIIY